jgi:hypothetical protein
MLGIQKLSKKIKGTLIHIEQETTTAANRPKLRIRFDLLDGLLNGSILVFKNSSVSLTPNSPCG